MFFRGFRLLLIIINTGRRERISFLLNMHPFNNSAALRMPKTTKFSYFGFKMKKSVCRGQMAQTGQNLFLGIKDAADKEARRQEGRYLHHNQACPPRTAGGP